jgi:hypothetical protein
VSGRNNAQARPGAREVVGLPPASRPVGGLCGFGRPPSACVRRRPASSGPASHLRGCTAVDLHGLPADDWGTSRHGGWQMPPLLAGGGGGTCSGCLQRGAAARDMSPACPDRASREPAGRESVTLTAAGDVRGAGHPRPTRDQRTPVNCRRESTASDNTFDLRAALRFDRPPPTAPGPNRRVTGSGPTGEPRRASDRQFAGRGPLSWVAWGSVPPTPLCGSCHRPIVSRSAARSDTV